MVLTSAPTTAAPQFVRARDLERHLLLRERALRARCLCAMVASGTRKAARSRQSSGRRRTASRDAMPRRTAPDDRRRTPGAAGRVTSMSSSGVASGVGCQFSSCQLDLGASSLCAVDFLLAATSRSIARCFIAYISHAARTVRHCRSGTARARHEILRQFLGRADVDATCARKRHGRPKRRLHTSLLDRLRMSVAIMATDQISPRAGASQHNETLFNRHRTALGAIDHPRHAERSTVMP